jgi:hypothetical protein
MTAWLCPQATLPGCRAATPGPPVGHAARHPLGVLAGLHDAGLGQRVLAVLGHRRGVRVRGAEEQFLRIEVGQPVAQFLSHLCQNSLPDRHQVAGHDDRLIQHLIGLTRFQRQGGGVDRRRRRLRNAHVALSIQRHRLVRGDVHRGGSDVQLGRRQRHGTPNAETHQRHNPWEPREIR